MIKCSEIHAIYFEFYAICAVKCWQQKKDNVIADSLGLLKMEHYMKEKQRWMDYGTTSGCWFFE